MIIIIIGSERLMYLIGLRYSPSTFGLCSNGNPGNVLRVTSEYHSFLIGPEIITKRIVGDCSLSVTDSTGNGCCWLSGLLYLNLYYR